jgi:CelD/BcsL family acetyltransferase involved in cellulose biosynthesis
VGFAFGGSLYLYYSGYDPAWGKYSVMTTVMAEAIRYAIAEGFAEVNLSTGNDVSKTRWGPKSHVYREALQRSGLPRGNVALKAYRCALKARENKTLRNLAGRFLARRSE